MESMKFITNKQTYANLTVNHQLQIYMKDAGIFMQNAQQQTQ